MLHIPISRWGEPYKSLDLDKVAHFATGEALGWAAREGDEALGQPHAPPVIVARTAVSIRSADFSTPTWPVSLARR